MLKRLRVVVQKSYLRGASSLNSLMVRMDFYKKSEQGSRKLRPIGARSVRFESVLPPCR